MNVFADAHQGAEHPFADADLGDRAADIDEAMLAARVGQHPFLFREGLG